MTALLESGQTCLLPDKSQVLAIIAFMSTVLKFKFKHAVYKAVIFIVYSLTMPNKEQLLKLNTFLKKGSSINQSNVCVKTHKASGILMSLVSI